MSPPALRVGSSSRCDLTLLTTPVSLTKTIQETVNLNMHLGADLRNIVENDVKLQYWKANRRSMANSN